MPEDFTNQQVLRLAMDSRLSEVRTALPGKVKEYDRTNQTATVEPQVVDEKNPLSILQNVPVAFPRSSSSYFVFDLVEGDFGLIVFCEREIGEWRNEGAQVTPADVDALGPSSPVFLPGLFPSGNSITQSSGRTILGGDDIRLVADDADQRVYKGDDLKTTLGGFMNAVNVWAQAVRDEIAVLGGDVSAAYTSLNAGITLAKAGLSNDLSDKVRIK